MPWPLAVILVPPFDVRTSPFIFRCFTRVLTAPSPSARPSHSASLLVLPLFSISWRATNTCTTSKESTLLGAYLLATLSSALMYVCICHLKHDASIYSFCASWIIHPILYITPTSI